MPLPSAVPVNEPRIDIVPDALDQTMTVEA
jgi:hypothetical protein